MTKLFPQQRFFAIIIFISFCLHTALFISGTVKQTAKSRIYKSERILTQLTNEFAFPLVYKDRVSLSVIANSYAKQYDINRIVIRNADGELLVQSGIDPMLSGDDFEKDIKVNKSLIGHIEITLKSVSNGEIIKFLWIFIATSLIIHLGVWFLYLHFSNPSEEDLQKIRDELEQKYLQQHKLIENVELAEPIIKRERKQAPKKVLMELADYILEYKANKTVNFDNSAQTVISKTMTSKAVPKIEKQNGEKQSVEKQTDTSESRVVTQSEPMTITAEKQVKQLEKSEKVERLEKIEQSKNAKEVETELEKVKEINKENEEMNKSNNIIDATKNRGGATKFTSTKRHSILFSKITKKPDFQSQQIDKQAKRIVQIKQSTLIKKRHQHNKPSLLSGQSDLLNRQASFTKLVLEFKYVDKYQLLDKVMPTVASSYFAICSQFLQMAIQQLLQDERLQGISLANQPSFSIQGAKVELQTTNNKQKQLLLASSMLGVLYQMINQVIYDTRREAKLFAFNMNVGIAYIEQDSILSDFSEFNEYENVIVALQYSALKLIENEVTINKNTEQKYHYISNMSEDLLLTLIRIRNKILEME